METDIVLLFNSYFQTLAILTKIFWINKLQLFFFNYGNNMKLEL